MQLELLAADVDELRRLGATAQAALERGASAIGRRAPLATRLDDPERSDRRLRDLVDLYAEAEADARLVRFEYARSAPRYEETSQRFEQLRAEVRQLRAVRAPTLALELLELRALEETLGRSLAQAGPDPAELAPPLRPGETNDLSYALLHVPRATLPRR